MRFTADERATVEAARAIQARTRKAAKAMRPKPVQPTAEGQRSVRLLDKAHKGFIARLFCLATKIRTGLEVHGVQVCHVRFALAVAGWENPGLQRKPSDARTLPLSPDEHRLQHSMSEIAFYAELGLAPAEVAALCGELVAASGDVDAGRRVLRDYASLAQSRRSPA